MKRLTDSAWFTALTSWRTQRRRAQDPADMGTAFGLDSITVIDFESSAVPGESGTGSAPDWHRRVTRRSRL
jgi:hypothetical protein